MGKRANALAERIEQGAAALAAFVEMLSDDQWQTLVPNDRRTVGVLVHHVASNYSVEIDLARQIASGDPITKVTWDDVAQMNAKHAQEYQDIGKEETLRLLRNSSKLAADRVREFKDKELDNAAAVSLNADAPLTAQFFIEDHALQHSFHHLANIRAALKG